MRIELFTLKNFKYKLRQKRGGTQNYAWYIMSVQYIKVVIIKPQMSTCSFSCGLLCLPCLFSICSLKWWTCLETQALLLPNNSATHSIGLDLFYQNSEAFCIYMSHLLSCVGEKCAVGPWVGKGHQECTKGGGIQGIDIWRTGRGEGAVLSHKEEDIVEIKTDLFTSSSFKGSVGMFLCKMGVT